MNSFKKKLIAFGCFWKNSCSFRKIESSFGKNLSLKEFSPNNRSVYPKNEYSSGQNIIFQTILIKQLLFFPKE